MGLSDYFSEHYTSERLKEFIKLLGGSSQIMRKADRVQFIVQHLLDPESLRQIWKQMDGLSRKAVAAAYHNDGIFDAEAFVAQYGSLPQRPSSGRWQWYRPLILFDLFLQNGRLHPELMPLLADLVPPPERFQLQGLVEAPRHDRVNGETVELIRADTEEAGWHDLLLLLQLVEQGDVRLSKTSNRLTPGCTELLLGKLLQGDFFPPENPCKFDETIRPFGLTQFAIGAGLISTAKNGVLTDRGRTFLVYQEPELLLEAFETWVERSSFDEVSRISALRGTRARGVTLTPPSMRRERIVEALSWCPQGVWISVTDFLRAIKIWQFNFDIEEGGLRKIYIGQGYYASQYGYTEWADDPWLLTTGLYIMTVLWEYLGSIGALDLLYLPPEKASLPGDAYYYDERNYSRYDGLCYFRITPLGAYLFGQASEYQPRRPADEPLFIIGADRCLRLLQPGQLTPVLAAQLEQIGEPVQEGVYRLDEQKILLALEGGMAFSLLQDLLRQRHQGPLPAEVEEWLHQLYANSRAFSIRSRALLIRAGAEEVEMALADPVLGKFARRVDARTLVIPASQETRFRNRLRELGYGIR